jgi:ABC-type transport system involved in multi-copper enzyme maturation permease subunit
MGKLIVGLLLFVFAVLLFMPALLVSIMSSDSSPQAGTPLPVIIDLLIGFTGLVLIGWGIIGLIEERNASGHRPR